MLILIGDVGGTKTSLQLSVQSNSSLHTKFKKTYSSKDYDDFFSLLDDFLYKDALSKTSIKVACVAIAGPVQKSKAIVTNLPWVVSEQKLKERFNIKYVKLINDFQAVGYGLASLDNRDLETLQIGKPSHEGTKALIGAGTGLGESIIVSNNGYTQILPSEGGRTDFAPREESDVELLKHIMQKKKRVACEEILSGKGLVRIFEFLKTKNVATETRELREQLKLHDPAAQISIYGLSGKDRLAELALHQFVKIYGAVAGNFALTAFATGGVYVAGGIAPKIITKLKDGTFIDSFNDNPKMSSILKNIPVHVVLNENVGLLGAREIALRLAKK